MASLTSNTPSRPSKAQERLQAALPHIAEAFKKYKTASSHGSGRTRGPAWDLTLTPLINPDLNVPIISFDNGTAFSASDAAFFAQPASVDAITISGEDKAMRGGIAATPAAISWGISPSDIEINTSEEVCWKYTVNTDADDTDYPMTNAVYSPLTRSDGRVETFRVDFYRSKGSNFDSGHLVYNDANSGAEIFASEGLAVQLLITNRMVAGRYVQTDVRVKQSSDEIALVHARVSTGVLQHILDDTNIGGVFFLGGYDIGDGGGYDFRGSYPKCTVADALRRGVQADSGSAVTVPTDPFGHGIYFLDEAHTTEGIVMHSRIPLRALTWLNPRIERPDTLGMPIPSWFFLVVALVIILSLHKLMR